MEENKNRERELKRAREEKAKKRHKTVYRFLQAVVSKFSKSLLRYEYDFVENMEHPAIILANHNTDLDPVLLGLAFPDQMYFVASEHVFRKKLLSSLLNYFLAPISRVKGATDAASAMAIIRNCKSGNNVCLFAEGNRSYTGVTGSIFPATGKLIKTSGATLYTYRLEGGYLVTPRWARWLRRGPIRGRLIGCYSPAELKKLTPDEVNARIAEDLYEDAFKRQEAEPNRYTGKHLAEWLEVALYTCPVCGKMHGLHSHGDAIACKHCGFTARYTEYGFFEGEQVPYRTVRDWDAYQTSKLKELANALEPGEEAFSDEGVVLERIEENHGMTRLATGRLSMTREALCLGTYRFDMASLSGMAMFAKSKIAMTHDGKHYELRMPVRKCGRKYFTLYQILRGELD